MNKLFEISINEKLYPVYQILGKEHSLGTYNGCPSDWWLLYDDDMNESKLLDEMSINSNLIPYIDKGVHRICWEINYKQYNNIRFKYAEYDIRDGGECLIKANGREIYKFISSDLMFAMSKVSVTIQRILGHPYNFLEPEKDNGRKIFFCGLPAFVYQGYEVGEIKIKPDYSVISKKKWWYIYDFYNQMEELNFDNEQLDINFDELDNPNLFADPLTDETIQEENGFTSDELMRDETLLYETPQEEYGYATDIINWGDALEDGKINWFRR